MQHAAAPSAILREDYTVPAYLIEQIHLDFHLKPDNTLVSSELHIRRNPEAANGQALLLSGENLELVSVSLDGQLLAADAYELDEHSLSLNGLPESCVLQVVTRIQPASNTALEGLYLSSGNFCTQCEPEGFRKITYFMDRPDIMAKYQVRVQGDKTTCPILLSNGNPIAKGDLEDNQHFVVWEDPFPKPSYLFALVAGDLACIEDEFVTQSDRKVALRIYVQHHNKDKCAHAMRSLKKAMLWDEEKFGLEYDLDIYMIVAVDDFNMGAMENKGLNIFNSKAVLADPKTATDNDFQYIERVIAHEYFHNWTGNRVTCRDWFQLSLKEGLTVFRDQQFSIDVAGSATKRIEDADRLRQAQFPQDAGPLAHPVRPDSYMEVNNFYTLTIYEKGAEVIRMMHTLLGAENFRKGIDLYFERHDGQAVTCDDFAQAMQDASGVDLEQFRLWYSQAGTPVVSVEENYSAEDKTYRLTLSQQTPKTPGQDLKQPVLIPVRLGLLSVKGDALPLQLRGDNQPPLKEKVLRLLKDRQTFEFEDVPEKPVLSLLRGLSAPVKIQSQMTTSEYGFLMLHDPDAFNRWDAAQKYALTVLLDAVLGDKSAKTGSSSANFIEACKSLLLDDSMEPGLLAAILSLPSESYIGDQMEIVDIDGINAARHNLQVDLARELESLWLARYQTYNQDTDYDLSSAAIGKRSLKNLALSYLCKLKSAEHLSLARQQFKQAQNMTDELSALRALVNNSDATAELEAFYQKWKHENLVVDKWLAINAAADVPDALQKVIGLTQHPAFEVRNPNRVRALLASFCTANLVHFHAKDGAGYELLADYILKLNTINPQMAARASGFFSQWRSLDASRQKLIKAQLNRIAGQANLSSDVYEVISKSLD